MSAPAWAAASVRNSGPILDVLRYEFAGVRTVLEIGTGTACHAVRFAQAMPALDWQTGDLPDMLGGIRDALALDAPANVRPPIELDMNRPPAPEPVYDAVYSSNTWHIMSETAARRSLPFIAASLRPGGVFCYYGPFRRGGRFNADSNEAFDRSLRHRDDAMGLRELDLVTEWAGDCGLRRERVYAMPANNLLLAWRRVPGG